MEKDCGMQFGELAPLKKHMLACHPGVMYECPHQGCKFKSVAKQYVDRYRVIVN